MPAYLLVCEFLAPMKGFIVPLKVRLAWANTVYQIFPSDPRKNTKYGEINLTFSLYLSYNNKGNTFFGVAFNS